jgi:flagella basal body P-ring formation protein FlgA
MALPASDIPHAARRVRACAARMLAAWAIVAAGGAGVLAGLLPASASAQESGGPIVIPGPGEKNPAALAAMAERMNTPATATPPAQPRVAPAAMQIPVSAPPPSPAERSTLDRFANAAKAEGAIVIPGAGESQPAPAAIATRAPAQIPAPALTRVSLQTSARQVMPVLVTPAQQPAATQAVAANPPASASAPAFDSLASRGEPPQLGANANPRVPPADMGRVVPPSKSRLAQTAVVPQAASQAAQPVQPAAATAAGQQDAEAIRRTALAFLQQQASGLPGKVEITVAQVFPRGLAACTTLEPFMPTGTRLWGRTTVGVRCAGEHPWTLYMQARISLHATYYLASRAIAPGEILTAADLVARDGDLTNMPQAIVTEPSQAVGSVALMRMAAGLPLRQDMLRSASSVSIGQTVKVIAQGQGFAISSEGSAMNNAAPGQPVRVKTAAGQIIQGVVKDGGTVEIQL